MDRLVQSTQEDVAAAHLTEDGYVRHRIAELARKRSLNLVPEALGKSA